MSKKNALKIDQDALLRELKESAARQKASASIDFAPSSSSAFKLDSSNKDSDKRGHASASFGSPKAKLNRLANDNSSMNSSLLNASLTIGDLDESSEHLNGKEEIREAMDFFKNDDVKFLLGDAIRFGKAKEFNGGKGPLQEFLGSQNYSSPVAKSSDSSSSPLALSYIEHSLTLPPNENACELFEFGITEYLKNGVSEPSFDVLIAWLAYAAKCLPSDLLPSGEIFPNQDTYIRERLVKATFHRLEGIERIEECKLKVTRMLSLISFLPLTRLTNNERSFLLFALGKLLKEMPRDVPLISEFHKALINIFKSSQDLRDLMLSFAEIFQHISDSLVSLRYVLQSVRACNVHSSLCLLILLPVLIHYTERAECAVDVSKHMSFESLNAAYFSEVIELLDDSFDVFKDDVDTLCAFYNMLDASLTAELARSLPKANVATMMARLSMHKKELARWGTPDSALLDLQVRMLLRRLEIACNAGVDGFEL